jgi:glycosyltransferase involved in cell wall biosynthesis
VSKKIVHTVIVVAYNHERFISAALDSILTGEKIADQIIIVDDCSNDSTVKVIETYQVRYPHIIEVISNNTNLGVFDNLNKIYSLPVKGNIISFLAGDDIYDSSLLAEIDAEILRLKLDPLNDSFMTLPNVANILLDDTIEFLDNSLINNLSKVSPFQIALRSKLYSMHVGISFDLYRQWASFPENAMSGIGIYADLIHYLSNIKSCKSLIPVTNATTYHRVGVGMTSRSHLLSPQESKLRAMKIIESQFKSDLDFSDRIYIKYSMSIDKIYTSKSVLGLIKVLLLLPVGLLVDEVDKAYYLTSLNTLTHDLIKKINFIFRDLL